MSHWLAAPAKVNLRLLVLGARDDGYHELDGIMARLRLHDDLALDPSDAGVETPEHADRIVRERVGDPLLDAAEVPLDGGNLIVRAGDAYRQAAALQGVRVPLLRWRLRKRIPLAAGFAGGSTDAACALLLLAERFPAGLDLHALAQQLGSDVPFFLLPAAAARARGRGERLERVVVPEQPLVLAYPSVAVRAGDAYAWWRGAAAEPVEHGAPWWEGPPLRNDLEAGVAAHVPEVAALLRAMRAAHDGPVLMSGSGSACFALTRDAAGAAALAAQLRATLPATTWVHASALGGAGARAPRGS